jgi:phosphatidylglycerol:prolipoprotein diacylglycerol transferase
LLVFPNFDPAIVTIPRFRLGPIGIGPLAVRWYALAYIAGILLGWRYAMSLVRNPKLWGPKTPTATPLQVDDLVLWIALGVILGGRIGYVLFYMLPSPAERAQLVQNPLEVLMLWHGGMSFHGGFIGVVVALIAFARVNRIDLLLLGDLVAPCQPIGQFFGRIANFINGELWGRPTHLPWGMIFPSDPDQVPRHPSQLYEAALEGLLIFLVLRWATHRVHWLQRRGALSGMFLVLYGLIRILLEQVRNPDLTMPIFPLGLTMGMMLSAPMVIVGGWLLWRGLQGPAPDQTEAREPA